MTPSRQFPYADRDGRISLTDANRLRPPTGNSSVTLVLILAVAGIAAVGWILNR